MIVQEASVRQQQVFEVAKMMMNAARTAPKARGLDALEMIIITGDDLELLAQTMERLGVEQERTFFSRDAANIRLSSAVLAIGARIQVLGLNCGDCAYPSCADKPKDQICVFNGIDLGVAIGSACTLASHHGIDNRVMFSVGSAIKTLNWLPNCHLVYGIPLSVSTKNPFFDRG